VEPTTWIHGIGERSNYYWRVDEVRICGSVKSFKDPVHGYVDICGALTSIIDSWIMQRLRSIKQTAFAYMVYHGMEHSRFNHSLGSGHLAGEVINFIAANTRLYFRSAGGGEFANTLLSSAEVFQLAALVHDVGHLPYSHSSEVGVTEARLIYKLKGFEKLPLRHEAYTYALLGIIGEMAEEAGVEPVFTSSVPNDLRLILQGSGTRASALDYGSACAANVLHQLIAGGLDVDRMDYLIRDSIYAGVRYGIFDVDRLVRVLLASPLLLETSNKSSVEVSKKACQVMVLDKGVSIIEAFLLARFYMFSEVYLHRVVEAYNSIYARLFSVLARDGLVSVETNAGEIDIPTPESIEKKKTWALEAWKTLDDVSISWLIRGVYSNRYRVSKEARQLATMLVERKHPKIYHVIEDKQLWGLYTSYLYEGYAPEWAKPLLDELLSLQNEYPLLMVRPLRVDVISLSQLGVYNRSARSITALGSVENGGSRELRRLQTLAELSLYRIVVFSQPSLENVTRRAMQILQDLSNEAGKEERK